MARYLPSLVFVGIVALLLTGVQGGVEYALGLRPGQSFLGLDCTGCSHNPLAGVDDLVHNSRLAPLFSPLGQEPSPSLPLAGDAITAAVEKVKHLRLQVLPQLEQLRDSPLAANLARLPPLLAGQLPARGDWVAWGALFCLALGVRAVLL